MNEFDNVYNSDVQRFLLSCLIDDPDAFVRCRTIVKEDYFDDKLLDGEFRGCDSALRQLQVSKLAPSVMVSILGITIPCEKAAESPCFL